MITKTEISNLLVSMFDAAGGAANLASLEAHATYKGATYTLADLSNDLALSPLYTAQYTGMSNAMKAEALNSQFGHSKGMLGLYETAEAELAYTFFMTSLDAGATTQSLQVAATEFLAVAANATAYPIASATMVNKQAVAEYYSVTKAQSSNSITDLVAVLKDVTNDVATVATEKADIDAATTISGSNIALTDGRDAVTGTAADDMFLAHVAQNTAKDGSIANALSTGDFIDGGAGTKDELSATIINDNQTQSGNDDEINAITKNVEMVRLQVLDENVIVDAGAMDGVKEFWSDNSENQLIVDDIRLGTGNSVTKDITFGVKDSDATHNFMALLESQALTNSGAITSNSQILIEAAYEKGSFPVGVTDANPVQDLFVQVNFTGTKADGTTGTYNSGFIRTNDPLLDPTDIYPDTYLGLSNLIKAQLDAAGFTNLTVALGTAYTSITTSAGSKPIAATTANQIVITDPAGNAFTGLTSGAGQSASAAASDVASLITTVSPTTSTTLIETNLILDNAGRGSTMGNVTIAGESNSDKAPEQINIMVDRDSAISTLSTNGVGFNDNELQKVVITSVVTSLKEDTTKAQANGDLEIGSIVSWVDDTNAGNLNDIADDNTATSIDATAFMGTNLMLGTTTELGNTAINNLNTLITGSSNVTFIGSTTEANGVDSDEAYSYTTGAGNDTITFTLDGDSVDAQGESFALNTAGGNDTVTVAMDATAGVSFNTMGQLNNLNIDLGAGNDTLTMNGYGTFDIKAGDGADFVHVNSLTAGGNGNATAGTWTVGQATGAQNFGTGFGTASSGRVLYEAKLTLSFGGIEETVSVVTTAANNFMATQLDVNTAIKLAVSTNTELAKLLTIADVNGGESMTITSTVGGLNDLGIAIYQPQLVATTAGVTTGLAAGGNVLLAAADVSALAKGLIATTTETSDTLSDNTGTYTAASIINDIDVAPSALFSGSLNNLGAGDGRTFSTIEYSHDTARNVNADGATDIFDNAGANQYVAYTGVGATAATLGTDATTNANLSTITGSTGNDLIVLHSNDTNAAKLQFTAGESFGNDTVVNFHDISAQDVAVANAASLGVNILSFGNLDNQSDASAGLASNTDSAVAFASTVNMVAGVEGLPFVAAPSKTNIALAIANSANVLRFDEAGQTADTFASLTGTTLLAALNTGGASAHGNITAATLGASNLGVNGNVAVTQLVGTTQKHVLLVENGQNQGEYKVFELTSEVNAAGAVVNGSAVVTAGFFTNATLTGSVDFGGSINFVVGGSNAESLVLTGSNLAGTPATVAEQGQLGITATGLVADAETAAVAAVNAAALANGANATITANSTVTAYNAGTYTVQNTVDGTFSTFVGGNSVYVNAGVTLTGTAARLVGTATDGVTFVGLGTVAISDTTTATPTIVNQIDAKSAITVDVTASITFAADTAANFAAMIASTGTTLNTTWSSTVNSATSAAADLVAMDAATNGAIITTSVTATTGNFADTTAYHADANNNFNAEANAVTATYTDAVTGTLHADIDTAILGDVTGNSFTMGAGAAKVVTGGTQVDTITGGTGTATITGGAGADLITLVNGVVQTVVTQVGSVDEITTFTTTEDIVHIDLSELTALANVTQVVDLDAGVLAAGAAGASVVSADLNADFANGTGDEIAQFNTNFASLTALQTALEAGGAEATIVNGAWAAGDAFLALWDDGVNSHLAVISTSAAVLDNGNFAAGTLTATDIVQFTGIADATGLATADFVVIA